LLAEEDPESREQKFAELTRGWAAGSPAFRAELHSRMNQPIPARFAFLGADGAAREARMEIWEERLRGLATAFGISLDRLPPKKSATEKLVLAAALKRTTSVSIGWLAQRLEMGSTDSVGSLLHRFRVSGGMDKPEFKTVLSRFLA
jgi:putative transposase